MGTQDSEDLLGMDIAESAVKEARARSSSVEIPDRGSSLSAVEDLDPTAFQSFDFIVALGLIPYLTDEGMKRLSTICKGKKYVMDYHPREASVFNAIHAVYRRTMGYPFYRMFSDSETKDRMASFGFAPYQLISRGPLRMIESV